MIGAIIYYIFWGSIVYGEEIKVDEISKGNIEKYALEFAEDYYNHSLSLELFNTDDLYNVWNEQIGYIVNVSNKDKKCGYVVFDLTKEKPIIMYSFEEECISLREEICEGYGFNERAVDAGVYYIGNEIFAVGIDGGAFSNINCIYDVKSKSRTSGTTKYVSHSQFFANGYTGIILTNQTISQYDLNKSTLSESDIESHTGKYACAVMALTEIAYQEGIRINNSTYTTFNTLWILTGTTIDPESSGTILYGTTDDSMLASAMSLYAIARGKVNTSTITMNNPNWTFFVNQVNNNYSGTLTYRILKTNNTISGHTINVFGFCVSRSGNKVHKYLKVADGWYVGAKYFLLEEIDFVNSYGVTYNIQ